MNESEVGAQPGPWWATPPGAPATLSHTPGRPAQSGARFLLQQQLAAGQPQAVLAQSGPLLFRLQAQRVGRAGPTASCRAGMAEGQGWGSREARGQRKRRPLFELGGSPGAGSPTGLEGLRRAGLGLTGARRGRSGRRVWGGSGGMAWGPGALGGWTRAGQQHTPRLPPRGGSVPLKAGAARPCRPVLLP